MTDNGNPTSKNGIGVGLGLPLAGLSLQAHRPVVEQIRGLGYTDVWRGEGSGMDAFTPLAMCSAWDPTLSLGTAIVPAFTRGPAVIAQTAATLAHMSERTVYLGLGSSIKPYVHDGNGMNFDHPYLRVRDAVRFTKRALRGEVIEGGFDTIDISRFQLGNPPQRVPRVLVGALRSRMMELAFAEADGAIANLMSFKDIPSMLAAIDAPRENKDFVVKLFVCATADEEFAERRARQFVAGMVSLPPYRAFHAAHGRDDALAEMDIHVKTGNKRGAADAIPLDVVNEIYVSGTPDQCREKIERFVQVGVTSLVLYLDPTPESMSDPESVLDVLPKLIPR